MPKRLDCFFMKRKSANFAALFNSITMKTQLITAITCALFFSIEEAAAQHFNTISDTRHRFKVSELSENSIQKKASQHSDTSTVDMPLPKDISNKKESEQTRYPLSVSYPLRQSKLHVSSPYGVRMHPTLKVRKMHNGVDLRASYEPVYAMLPGTVVKTGYDAVSGNFVTLQHASMRVSYCHLSVIGVKKGTSVYAGQPLGISGNTGRSTGPHLHLTLRVSEKTCDPMLLLKIIERKAVES